MPRYHVYILASPTRTLYIGVTNNLRLRLDEHRSGIGSEFTRKYRVFSLVYAEQCERILEALEREKQIKRWRRAKKVALIEEVNPEWRDLAETLW